MVKGLRTQNFLGKMDEEIHLKQSRFTEALIMCVLRQPEGGLAVPEMCREHGISRATVKKWRAKYGGMDASMMSKVEPLMEWMVPAPGIAMCHVGCCQTYP